ncbi:MAG: carbohydrate kinase [Spirochaetales bacterium]|nr:carbohydrate kinase [Spirochaetales bacterium]
MGLCGHGPSPVLVDRKGKYITDIITWQDNTALDEALILKNNIPGFSKDGTSCEAKLYKLFRDRIELFEEGIKVLYPKDYIISLLTNRRIIDHSTAGTLAFFNKQTGLFNTFGTGIPTYIFPEVIKSWETAGTTNTAFSRKAGLNDNIPVIAGGIDAWCEALGAGAVDKGMLVDGSGTSTCITCCMDNENSGLAHVIPERALTIETMSATGASVDWIKDLLNITISEISELKYLKPVPVIYLPYLEGERSPVWDERASASFTGLNSGTSRKDLVLSVLQGISFGTRQCIELAGGETSDCKTGIRAVGGGAKNHALLQLKADITGYSYSVMKEADAAPLGAMILASFGCGTGSLAELVEKWVKTEFEIIPDKTYMEIWDELFYVYSSHYNSMKEANHNLFEIRNRLIK